MFQQQNITEATANKLAKELTQIGIMARCNPCDSRDWLAKVTICHNGQKGRVCVYSNAAGQTSIKTHELRDKSIEHAIQICWEKTKQIQAEINIDQASGTIKAFVDGSFMNERAGYGIVIVDDKDKVIHTISGRCSPTGQRNIDGEIVAAVQAIEWAEKNNINHIEIVHDYIGIAEWVNGNFSAKTNITQGYVARMRKSTVKQKFTHVRGHTGNPRNEQADLLAASGTNRGTIDFDTFSLETYLFQTTLAI